MGPNIKTFPLKDKLQDNIEGKIVLKVGDDITTDHIMPSNASLLPYRSNIPYLSKYAFSTIDENFWEKCQDNGGFIVGGENYGQGSSREHAALVPLYLGIKAIFAKSFARIHKANLINAGILPLEFIENEDYKDLEFDDKILLLNLKNELTENGIIEITNKTKNKKIKGKFNGNSRDIQILKSGGYLNWINKKLEADKE
jgi:aconitate hydratase